MESIVKKPNLYDLLYQNVTEDISMYIKLLKESQNILEFGAGTGRVTIPLAEAGHNIDAVDIEERMLTGLSERIKDNPNLSDKINPILGNMCNYNSGKLYDAVIIPLTSFNYLLSEEEQILCLKSVRNNLKAGGFAIIELLSKNTYNDVAEDNEFTFVKRIDINSDQHYEYYRNTHFDFGSSKIVQKRLFKLYKNGAVINEERFIWRNRFVTIDEFKRLVEMVGLTIETIYGNCELEEYNENSEDIFIKLRRS